MTNDKFKFRFDIYQRRFKQPLRTSHGLWQIREGIIIALEDSTGIAQGEIAPLPWFGSETMSQALSFCQQLGDTVSVRDIFRISDRLRCCQFAFESALLNLKQPLELASYTNCNLDYCYLLPAGDRALESWQSIYQTQSNSTFKWKIGVYPQATEIEILKQLVASFPAHIKLRLDANGGLNLTQAKTWLAVTDKLPAIEFVEQPLPPDCFTEILKLSQEYNTRIALDESVASFTKLQQAYKQKWRGVFVIKAAIMGFPSKIEEFCTSNSLDIVLSSVFETKVGRSAAIDLAHRLNHPRAVGFGIDHFY